MSAAPHSAPPGCRPISEGFAGTVGNTPLIRIGSLSRATNCTILGKAEFMNPGGSIKDRAAKYMVEGALRRGDLSPGALVVEATAGNTGVGLAHICLAHSLRCLFCCPVHVSDEKVSLLRRLGAEVVRCPKVPSSDPDHFQNTARRLANERGGYYINQFYNADNAVAHYETTGPEIWQQTCGEVDAIAVAPGTGGTISGCSKYLKEQKSSVRVYMNEVQGAGVTLSSIPFELPVSAEAGEGERAGEAISKEATSGEGDAKKEQPPAEVKVGPFVREKTQREKDEDPVEAMRGSTLMEGIGSSVLYGNLAEAAVDGVVRVCDAEGVRMTHYLLKHDGLYLGGSSGINVAAAYVIAKQLGPGHTIVTMLCDSGERYASKLYNQEWLSEHKMDVSPQAISDLSFMDACLAMNDKA